MVTPTNFSSSDLPEPPEPTEAESVESPIPTELVQEKIVGHEGGGGLDDLEIFLMATPTDDASTTQELATDILNFSSTENIKEEAEEPDDTKSDDQELTSTGIEEIEMQELEELETTEEVEEADLKLITDEILDDMLDPNAQDFRKLLDELLPLDDHAHIIKPEEIDRATYLIDLDHNIFYSNHPLSQEEILLCRPTLLFLDYTEEEIRHFKITYIKPKKWARLIRYLKMKS